MAYKEFDADLRTGKRFEKLLKQSLGATGECARHLGDFTYNNVFVEAKDDLKAKDTGNMCFEWADWYSAPKRVLVTGIFKHMTQPGNHVIIHRVNKHTILAYSPGAAASWLRQNRQKIIILPPWTNNTDRSNQGWTHGAIVPLKELPEHIFIPIDSLDQLREVCALRSNYPSISEADAIRTVQWFMTNPLTGESYQETWLPVARHEWVVKGDVP